MAGIFAYLIEVYIRPQDWVSFLYAFPLVNVIAGITIAIALFTLFENKDALRLPHMYALILYLVLVLASNIFTGHSDEAIGIFVIYLKRAATFFMLVFILRNSRQLKRVLALIVLLSVVLAVQSIFQSHYGVMVQGQKMASENRVAWVGAWDGPNVLCLLFVMATAFSLGFLSKPYSTLWRVLNLLFTITLVYGIYLTNSRGGYLGLIAVVGFFIWNKFMRRKRLAIKIAACLIGAALVALALKMAPSRMSELSVEEESAHERAWLWESGLNMVRDNPAFGVGKGQFRVAQYTAAHNNFVQDMAEMGYPGLFLYIALMYLSFKGLYAVMRSKAASGKESMISNLSGVLMVSMVGFNVVTYFVTMDLDFLFICLGLCAAALKIARTETGDVRFRVSIKDLGIVFCAMFAVVFTIYLIAVKEII